MTNKTTKETMTNKQAINKYRQLLKANPRNNQNATDEEILDCLNGYDTFKQAFDFVKFINKCEVLKDKDGKILLNNNNMAQLINA